MAENAFGNEAGGSGGNGGAGQCPNANPLSDAECEGKLSNCWSPGNCSTEALLIKQCYINKKLKYYEFYLKVFFIEWIVLEH